MTASILEGLHDEVRKDSAIVELHLGPRHLKTPATVFRARAGESIHRQRLIAALRARASGTLESSVPDKVPNDFQH
jgi:hypothetical protein